MTGPCPPQPPITGHRAAGDRRRQLVALWDALAAQDAVVHRLDVEALPGAIVSFLCESEARRLRALDERTITGPPPPPESSAERAQRAALRSLLAFIADVVAVDGSSGGAVDPDSEPAPVKRATETATAQPDGRPRPAGRPKRTVPDWLDLARLARTVPQRGWQRLAACRGRDPNWFHPGVGASQRDQKALCGRCPVRYACLACDLSMVGGDDDYGIWGGTSESERRAIRVALDARRVARTSREAA